MTLGLVHVCCAPCLCGVAEMLREKGYEFDAFWYNPNIQPYREYMARRYILERYQHITDVKVIYDDSYNPIEFLKVITTLETKGYRRCIYCYALRLKKTATFAIKNGYEWFTTTILISPYQDHNSVRSLGYSIASSTGIKFLYMDFRKNWKRSIVLSRDLGLYRQTYCGCILSEWDRYRDEAYVPRIY